MKEKVVVHLIIAILLIWAAPALAGGAPAQFRHAPAISERRPAAPQRFWGRPPARVYKFYSPPIYHRGFSHFDHWKHELYFGPHHHSLHSHPLLSVSPFVCLYHEEAFVNQAGFVDHVGGTHKIPLESTLSFCDAHGSSCIFPGY
jgi:hypothetical protein